MGMRKLLAMMLAALMLLSVAACGDDGGSESSAPSSSMVESSAPDSVDASMTSGSSASGTTTTTTKADDRGTTTSRRLNGSKTDTTTTTEKSTTTTTMSREQYLNQEKINIVGSSADEKSWIYQLGSGGVMVREATINSGKGGDPVEIVQISDIHFNKVNDKDLQEANPSIMAIKDFRKHMANGASRKNAEACLKYASYFDQTVVTGDTIDYLTWGALEMMEEVIWKPYPNALVTLGNHDIVRTWTFKGYVRDTTTLESRYQILQENWKHDIYYTSKVIGNKAMIIQMDNGNTVFWDSQIPKLEADIAKAKQNGYAVLLFFHIPIGTGNEAHKNLKPIRATDGNGDNLCKTALSETDSATKKVVEIIKNNADVVKGVFTGHVHNDHYVELNAKTSAGEDAVIPQYTLAGAFYEKGHVLKITVK